MGREGVVVMWICLWLRLQCGGSGGSGYPYVQVEYHSRFIEKYMYCCHRGWIQDASWICLKP